jgi:hypothetical protein
MPKYFLSRTNYQIDHATHFNQTIHAGRRVKAQKAPPIRAGLSALGRKHRSALLRTKAARRRMFRDQPEVSTSADSYSSKRERSRIFCVVI